MARCSYTHHPKRLRHGFLCLEQLRVVGDPGEEEEEGPPLPPREEEEQEEEEQRRAAAELNCTKPDDDAPLRGSRKHYLPLWNNEDPSGDMWVEKVAPLQDPCVDKSELTSLIDLNKSCGTKINNVQPLLVRIMHKSRLRYYGKKDTKEDVPYQAYFEVADHSGMMSMVLWNALCPEWYKSMKIGTVLLLEQYAVKAAYQYKTRPTPRDFKMRSFSSIEITLNVRDPSAKITIIPENKVKADWKLPEVTYRFITRSELDNLPNDYSCDIIGLVQYVGRTERTRKRDTWEDFWIYRWVHALDGTSNQPFVLELFATSQPEIFEQIHPMTYLVCTQMRVARDTAKKTSCTVYLTTSNETQIFITGWHKGQPYTKDSKVKNFIQWIKTQKEGSYLEKATMGGYYPFPPVPDTFLKYCKKMRVESVLTTIHELEKEIESLHYREHKRIAFQGIISAIRYVSCSSTSQDASGGEQTQLDRSSELQTSEAEDSLLEDGGRKQQQAKKGTLVQTPPPSPQHQHNPPRKARTKGKNAAAARRGSPPVPYQGSYFTRSTLKKMMLHKHLHENSSAEKASQDLEEAAELQTSNKVDVSERAPAEKTCHNSWESDLWTAVKNNLTQHLNYTSIFPESFPCKFNYTHKELLMRQCNLQAASCNPEDCVVNGDRSNLEHSCPLEYYEVAVLGLNHDIAIDVPFLSLCCPEDSCLLRASLPSYAALSPASGTSCPQESTSQEGPSEVVSVPGTGNTVAIMISYLKGKEILSRLESGYQVTMVIEVGKKHGSWMNNYSIFFVSVSFFIVTAATVGYFIFYSARRLRLARAQNRRQKRLKADAKKAIGRLQLRTLKQGDKETGSDADNCAVCIEAYKLNDVVRILTCNHLFHKSCIDPWLLEHRTCPMCKCDILKALGIEVDVEDRAESFQVSVSNEASNVPSLNEEDNHSETASSGYASVQGAEEPLPEEPPSSENDNLHLVDNTTQSPPAEWLPQLDNPGFEADEVPDRGVKC